MNVPELTSRRRTSDPLIGILGGGQLAAMLAEAAATLGTRVRVLDPALRPCAARRAPHIRASSDDQAALLRLAAGAECITLESESIEPRGVAFLEARGISVHPGCRSLEVCRDRLREKRFLNARGIRTAPWRAASSPSQLEEAARSLGGPVIAKTRTLGYDGRGQVRFEEPAEAERVWKELGARPLVVEAFQRFERELSLVSARSLRGEVVHYPLVENHHDDGILRRTTAPAPGLSAGIEAGAVDIAARLLRDLDHVGVLTIEFFETADGLVVNELAPRVHNSGHWTIEGAECSQFETHLRAILGWPLRSTRARGHAVMVNLIGDLPSASAMERLGKAHVHTYGKVARPGRKLGHVTWTGTDPMETLASSRRLDEALTRERHLSRVS